MNINLEHVKRDPLARSFYLYQRWNKLHLFVEVGTHFPSSLWGHVDSF